MSGVRSRLAQVQTQMATSGEAVGSAAGAVDSVELSAGAMEALESSAPVVEALGGAEVLEGAGLALLAL